MCAALGNIAEKTRDSTGNWFVNRLSASLNENNAGSGGDGGGGVAGGLWNIIGG